MKKLVLAMTIIAFVFIACGEKTQAEKDQSKIGVALYKFDDTFISTVRAAIEKQNNDNGKVAALNFADGQGQQATQNDSIDTFIAQGYNALSVNMVDRTSAPVIIEKAKTAGIPIVFFNREPVAEDMKSWDKIYYVGAKAEESGRIQGEAAAKYFKENPTADRNGDGIMQYVMLTGEPGHQDALLRTEYSTNAVIAAGIPIEELAQDTGMWQRINGQEKMDAWLAAHGDKIEVVFANNDDMALGAIEALKSQGYFGEGGKYMPVIGVDATAPAIDSIANGLLYATVLNDSKGQGQAIYDITMALAKNEDPTTLPYTFDDGQYVWIDYVPVTAENYKDFK